MNGLKVFTLEEANQMLPKLSELLVEIQTKRNQVSQIETEIDILELITDQEQIDNNVQMNDLIGKHRIFVAQFYSLVDQIHSHKCFLKDVDLGVLDFYGTVDGRMVYYCWRVGEGKIHFWHEIGQNYSQRQPLFEEKNP